MRNIISANRARTRAVLRPVATLLLVAAIPAGCGADGPGTSVQVALQYDDALQLETAEVTMLDRTQSANIAHQLLLLVPDERAGMDTPLLVWARKAGKRAAYGTRNVVPVLGETVDASLMLTTCTPGCQGNMLTSCTAPVRACTLACSEDGDAHCIEPKPSNGVEPMSLDGLSATTTISATTTFDVDTGAITGGLVRAMGTGIIGGIGYVQAPAFGAGGAPLGIFVFRNLTVTGAATIRFTGTRAVVWFVGDTALIAGLVDVSAGRPNGVPRPGPGGGAGGTPGSAAQGCGPGGTGVRGGTIEDSGGGGGGGGTPGAAGGQTATAAGGAAGVACLPSNLEPLQGGSGGGLGSTGGAATPGQGGGGGGALQITALGRLEITGTINAGGGGANGAPAPASGEAAAGGGGGGGGAILLESLTVAVSSTAILAANGGGGGAGATDNSNGNFGTAGLASLTVAPGGLGLSLSNDGGSGGVQGKPPTRGGAGSSSLPENGGGGGGAVGAIVIRGRTVTVAGTNTPTAIQLDLQTRNVP